MHRLRVLALLSLIFILGCSEKPPGKRYELQGKVVTVDSAARQLTIAHQDIPGLMPGMTMPFLVSPKDQWVFDKIAPGDKIHATLVLTDRAELEDINFTRSAPETTPIGASELRLPEPGDPVPDFAFLNQDGKRIHLTGLRGKPVLITFIYTRCPMPDFCLRMSNNFSEIFKELHRQPQVFDGTQLLSISIDPEHDTPAVLRRYGTTYVGNLDPKFQHWQFVTGSPEQITKAANYFGLAYHEQSGQIVHSLSTVLIGRDGKVTKVYRGNSWRPEEVASDYASAAKES